MKYARYIALLLPAMLLLHSCQKNTVSNIPQISLIAMVPDTILIANVDTLYIEFNLADGNGDIGYGTNPGPADTVSRVYLKDSRFPGYIPYDFPAIDLSIENPRNGIQGKCLFYPIPQPVPRSDSLHMATGDTLYYEFYITDRAGDSSNHVVTPRLIVKP